MNGGTAPVYLASEGATLGMAQRMRGWILANAQHSSLCRAFNCPDQPHSILDSRVACASQPCSCGLSAILDDLEPSVAHQLEEVDDDEGPTPVDFGA
jgi:hypothetical protein